jgi:hypothetical protein
VSSLVLLTAMSGGASGQEIEESSHLETKFAANVAAADGGQSATDGGRRASGPRHRPFVIGVFGLPLVTHLGPLGSRGAETVSPADRFAITQIVGGGYVLNRHVRFGVIAIFNEALTGLPDNADAWQFGGAAPVVVGTRGHLFVGGGAILSYRSGGERRSDPGAVVLIGASFPLKNGFALNMIAPVPVIAAARTTVSVGVGIAVAKVF